MRAIVRVLLAKLACLVYGHIPISHEVLWHPQDWPIYCGRCGDRLTQ